VTSVGKRPLFEKAAQKRFVMLVAGVLNLPGSRW
jgi:hypothetical protein